MSAAGSLHRVHKGLMRFLLLLLPVANFVFAAPPSAFSYGIDIYDPQEDIVAQVDTYVDATAGAAFASVCSNTTTATGNFDLKLVRNDLLALYLVMPGPTSLVRWLCVLDKTSSNGV
jgi:hypothetical protein